MTLDDEDAETFRGFNAWLYTDVVPEDIGSQRSFWRALFDLSIHLCRKMRNPSQMRVVKLPLKTVYTLVSACHILVLAIESQIRASIRDECGWN